MKNDTICALATAPGGALGIIRISGPEAFSIVSSICSVKCECAEPNTIHYTHIVSPASTESGKPQTIDEVMVSVFHAPRSYTGENSVEISCHGSRYILNKVLELLVAGGCRMARPGEYTMRAYLNGKMDLSQAEAVADLIASNNRASHQMAMSQLRGHFSSELAKLREQLLKLTSLLELELDFSDHEDLEFADRNQLVELTINLDKHITRLAHSFQTGQAIKQGVPVAIVGKTNVGKSTLLNRLIHEERAIVSDIHGTTRDTIEDTIDIQGVAFRFIDTAGIRQTTDTIEQMGIEKTYQMIEKARIVLWIIDQEPLENEFKEMIHRTNDKSLIIIINKIDKTNNSSTLVNPHLNTPDYPVIKISAKWGQGLDELERAIYQATELPALSDSDIIVTNARHYDALVRAHESLQRVLEGMGAVIVDGQWEMLNPSLSGDLLAEDLRLAIDQLGEITGGEITPNEVLGNIFTHFCVGK